jgi:glycerophosphoryl diester phosphodiesterase
MNENFHLIAHRGASLYTPENTLAAFNKALELGAAFIECDISFTKDGVPVIFHDDKLDRTSNSSGAISKKTLAELKKLDIGRWFSDEFSNEKILTLKDLLEWHNQHNVSLNLEMKRLKFKKFNQYLKNILHEVELYSSNPSIIYSSSQKKIIDRLAKLKDSKPRAYLVNKWSARHVKTARKLGCIQLNVGPKGLTSEMVDYTHEYHLKLGVYTVNDFKQACHLKEIGVDAIFTDDLNLFTVNLSDKLASEQSKLKS